MACLFHPRANKGTTQNILVSLLVSCALSTPIASFAAPFSGIVPGLGTINAPVKSMRELKLTGIVPQTYDFSCGAAALATLLKYGFDQNVSEKSILLDLMAHVNKQTVKKYGLSLLDLKSYALRHGLHAQGYKLSVQQLTALKVPALILMDIKGYKHFVVLNGVNDGQIYIADPMLGNRVIPLTEFTPTWNNIALIIMSDKFDRNSILLHPKKQPSAKELFKLSNPNGLQPPELRIPTDSRTF